MTILENTISWSQLESANQGYIKNKSTDFVVENAIQVEDGEYQVELFDSTIKSKTKETLVVDVFSLVWGMAWDYISRYGIKQTYVEGKVSYEPITDMSTNDANSMINIPGFYFVNWHDSADSALVPCKLVERLAEKMLQDAHKVYRAY
tara:strand:+ start:114 stop:557 length:444 start_codon:yes stop_codon:yes gene_type:complete